MQDSIDNVEEISVTIRWSNHCFRVKHNYISNNFFGGPYTRSIFSLNLFYLIYEVPSISLQTYFFTGI